MRRAIVCFGCFLVLASGCTLIAGISDNKFRDDDGSDRDFGDTTGGLDTDTRTDEGLDTESGSGNGSGGDTDSATGSEPVDTDTGSGAGCDGDKDCEDDGVACTIETCQNNICVSIPNDALCDDDNDCTSDVCHPKEGCRNPAVADFTPCEVITAPNVEYDICSSGRCVSPGTCEEAACNAPGPHVPLPEARHVDLVRDTVVTDQPVVEDPVTGLFWQGCAAGAEGDDCSGGAAQGYGFEDALTYCDGLDWGGHTDWRLPDPYELATLFNEEDSSGFATFAVVDVDAFPNWNTTYFWTTAASAFDPNRQWLAAHFFSMYSPTLFLPAPARGDGAGTFAVRCVRGVEGPVGSGPRFERKEQTTQKWVVLDHHTSKMWTGCTAGQSGSACASGAAEEMSFIDAQKYCNDSGWAGFIDWRLPTLKELISIVDFQREGVMTDFDAFPSTPGSWFWSGAVLDEDPPRAMSVSYEPFIELDALVTLRGEGTGMEMAYVRCVRNF